MLKLLWDAGLISNVVTSVLLVFLFSVALLIVCKVLKLFVRENIVLNKLTNLYYLYLPVVIILAAGGYFTVKNVERAAYMGIEEIRPGVTAYSAAYVKDMKSYVLKKEMESLSTNFSIANAKDLIKEYVMARPYFQGLSGDPTFNRVMSILPEGAKSFIAGKVADEIIKKINETLSDTTKLDKQTLNKLWNTDLEELAEGGIVISIMNSQVEARIEPIRSKIFKAGLFLLLLPFIETAVSKTLERRRKKEQTA